MVDRAKVTGFEQLVVWQKSQDLAVLIYKITKNFPSEEKFALTDQIRRASTSVSANIAEGFGRRTKKDKIYFYTISYGSLLETKNFIYLAERLSLVDSPAKLQALDSITGCQKLLNALMRSINEK